MNIQRYLKAITGAVVTGLGTLQIAYDDNVVTTQEWIGIAIATLVALGAVWAVPNAPEPQEAPAPTPEPLGPQTAPQPPWQGPSGLPPAA